MDIVYRRTSQWSALITTCIRLSDIQITTYEVDLEEMARRAIHNMISKISNENYKPGIHIVEGHLVLKESVAQIPFGKA